MRHFTVFYFSASAQLTIDSQYNVTRRIGSYTLNNVRE